MREPDQVEQAGEGIARAQPLDPGCELEIAQRRQRGQEVESLKHEADLVASETRALAIAERGEVDTIDLDATLGRAIQTSEQVQDDKHQAYDDAIARIDIEGKFGQGKRRFGLGRLMAKLALTSETMTHVSFLVMY